MGERRVVEGFDLFGGLHCETSAVQKVLTYHGLELSEEMLLGLGCGVGFLYWYMKGMPSPLVGGRGGRSEDLMANIALAMDGTIARITTGSERRAHATLMERLGAGEPTVIFADIAFLPYMAVPEAGHFGGHSVVIYGVDEDEDNAYISDRCRGPVTVTLADLKRARGSKFPPFAPKHAFLDIRHPKRVEITPRDIKRGISHSVRAMTEPPISNAGLKGFQKWAKLIVKWPQMFRGMGLFGALTNTFIYIETGGTGGSSLRPMYCRFLGEAREIVRDPALGKAKELYEESGRIWSEIAEMILPNEYPALKRSREILWEKDRIYIAQEPGALDRLHQMNQELDSMKEDILAEMIHVPAFLPEISQRILDLHQVEKEAIQMLQQVVT